MDILVFAPHPDDEIIGCGGSIAKQVEKGNKVSIVYLTSGESGSQKFSKSEFRKIREREAKAVAKVLGVKKLFFLREPDGYLEYNKRNLIKITNLIRKNKPQVIYLPHQNDFHADHQQTYRLVSQSIFRASGPWFQECKEKPHSVKIVLGYEVWTPIQNASYVEDITKYLDLKIKALQQYYSQIKDISYIDAVKGLNRYRGVISGVGKYAECFEVIKCESDNIL